LGRPPQKQTRLFGGGSCISLYLFILYAPPPAEEDIIMTTTIIIIEVTTEITLYTLFFNIRVYAIANIHPPSEKRALASNYF
jgi:hypothetical protein